MTTDDQRRRRNGRILVVVAGVVLLAIVGVGVVLLTSGGDGTDDPTKAAQSFVEVYQRGLNSAGRDVKAEDFEPYVCVKDMDGVREAFSAKENPTDGQPQFRMSVKDVKTDGDNGSFTITSVITTPGAAPTNDEENYGLVKENGAWHVCGLGA